MTKKIELDGDVADKITLLNLKDYRKYLTDELGTWQKNPKAEFNPTGVWLHPEDVTGNILTIEALNLVIKHFGG